MYPGDAAKISCILPRVWHVKSESPGVPAINPMSMALSRSIVIVSLLD